MSDVRDTETPVDSTAEADRKFRLKAGIFLASVTGLSAFIGFGTTVVAVKRQDPQHFNKGLTGTIEMADTGVHLALRALGWGTLYAFTGCGVLFYTIWKLSGATDLKDFSAKMGAILPRLSKPGPPTSRTEFTGLTDLLDYVSNEKFGKKDT